MRIKSAVIVCVLSVSLANAEPITLAEKQDHSWKEAVASVPDLFVENSPVRKEVARILETARAQKNPIVDDPALYERITLIALANLGVTTAKPQAQAAPAVDPKWGSSSLNQPAQKTNSRVRMPGVQEGYYQQAKRDYPNASETELRRIAQAEWQKEAMHNGASAAQSQLQQDVDRLKFEAMGRR